MTAPNAMAGRCRSATGEPDPPMADRGVHPVGQPGDHAVQPGGPQHPLYLVVGGVRRTEDQSRNVPDNTGASCSTSPIAAQRPTANIGAIQ
jgi:hypothetical protein